MSLSIFCTSFFFKQKTAYEIRPRDWSADVCSSDLVETCSTWCGASVASRYTRCGPMFTVATDGKVGVASPPPSRVGRAARCRTIGCIAAVAFRAVLSDPRRQRPLDTRPRVEMLPDSQRARSHCPDGTTGASRYLPHAKGRPPMTKLLSSVGVALVTLLAGCSLYFGNSSGSGGDGNGPSGGGSGNSGTGSPPGFQCNMDAQCAAGCFCANGVCTEGGFCASDKDCGNGFHCDVGRSSCIPNPACTTDTQCKPGSARDAKTRGRGL